MQELLEGMFLSIFFPLPPLPFSSHLLPYFFPFLPLLLEAGPLKPAIESSLGEHRKLPQWNGPLHNIQFHVARNLPGWFPTAFSVVLGYSIYSVSSPNTK